jgi:hypothetical protein
MNKNEFVSALAAKADISKTKAAKCLDSLISIIKNELRATIIDKYNIGIRCQDDDKAVVLEDKFIDNEGNKVRSINVV